MMPRSTFLRFGVPLFCAALMGLAACSLSSNLGRTIWSGSIPTGSWQILGAQGFGGSSVGFTAIAVDRTTGIPFVTFEDGAVGARATVIKYVSGSWTYVGSPGFSANTEQYNCIAVDSGGTPYVAFKDVSTNKANVMKYTGVGASGWQSVGLPDFSANTILWWMSFALDRNDVPFVAFVDSVSNQAIVEKYTAGAWSVVGAPFGGPGVGSPSLAIDRAGNPWLAFSDGPQGNKVTVQRYNGVAWSTVGVAGAASTGSMGNAVLGLDGSDIPFVAGWDTGYGDLLTAKTYRAGGWVNAGNPAFSAGSPPSVSMAMSPGGTPYVVYQDGTSGPASVMKFSGASWIPVGSLGFSPGEAQSVSLAMDQLGTPYVAFVDVAAGFRPTFMVYR